MEKLKREVLEEKAIKLCKELGDPKRYFPHLRSAGLLDQSDCEIILHEITQRDKVLKMLDIIGEGRRDNEGRPPFDAFVEGLVSEKVHAHLATELQTALARAVQREKAMAELESGDSSGDHSKGSAFPDGSGAETHEACDRGTHVPHLQLGDQEGVFLTIQPQGYHQITGLQYYPMGNTRHGVALIVSNKLFRRHSERVGSDRDEANLVQTWLFLGYRVEVRRNCTAAQIKDIFKDIDRFLDNSDKASNADSSVANDSFVSCFLSHGNKEEVMGTDSVGVKLEELERLIGMSNKLQNRPKLFFVQACRGPTIGAEVLADDDNRLCVTTNRSDMYFSYATVPGDKAYRSPVTGSWFVTELCKILCEFALSNTLHEMQHRINAAVPNNPDYKVPSSGAKYAQQPSNAGTMRKCLHFFDTNELEL